MELEGILLCERNYKSRLEGLDSLPCVGSHPPQILLCVTEAAPSDLRWQKPLLLDVAKSCISGCDDAAWPAAAPAATALVICLEGRLAHLALLLLNVSIYIRRA